MLSEATSRRHSGICPLLKYVDPGYPLGILQTTPETFTVYQYKVLPPSIDKFPLLAFTSFCDTASLDYIVLRMKKEIGVSS
eukprot:scaffold43228_cov71-Attheya_sp.AAC.2